MTRRKRKVGERGTDKKPRAMRSASLANLKRGGNEPPPGNLRGLGLGKNAEALMADTSSEVRELADLLAEAVPVKEDGAAPLVDVVAIEVAATRLRRWRVVRSHNDAHGRLDKKNNPTPASHYELTAEKVLHQSLDALGMSPRSRAWLGLDLVRAQSFDLAQRWALEGEAGDA